MPGYRPRNDRWPDEEVHRTVAVDLKGVWNCMRYEIIQMLQQGGGAIVNTSSQGGVTGFPGQAAYIACKHAVIGLTRTAAIDYGQKESVSMPSVRR